MGSRIVSVYIVEVIEELLLVGVNVVNSIVEGAVVSIIVVVISENLIVEEVTVFITANANKIVMGVTAFEAKIKDAYDKVVEVVHAYIEVAKIYIEIAKVVKLYSLKV